MTTRKRNIYPIGRWQRAACLAVWALLVAPAASGAQPRCDTVGGAGDEYCESIPGPGGDRAAAPAKLRGGIPAGTSRSLERAGAGSVRQVESPARERQGRPSAAASSSSPAPDPGVGEDGGRSVLPYILAALTLVLLLAALARRLRGASSPAT